MENIKWDSDFSDLQFVHFTSFLSWNTVTLPTAVIFWAIQKVMSHHNQVLLRQEADWIHRLQTISLLGLNEIVEKIIIDFLIKKGAKCIVLGSFSDT